VCQALERSCGAARLPEAARRLDQLGQGPTGEEQLRCVLARPLGRGERLFVTPEAVEQDRSDEVAPLNRESLAYGGGIVDGCIELRQTFFPTLEANQKHRGVRRKTCPSRLDDRISFRGRLSGFREFTRPRVDQRSR